MEMEVCERGQEIWTCTHGVEVSMLSALQSNGCIVGFSSLEHGVSSNILKALNSRALDISTLAF
jgi:hypothetical protein